MLLLLYILSGVAAVVVVLLIVGALSPAEWELERSLAISASPEKLFPHINSLKKWKEWMNWKPKQNSFEGPDEGPGGIWTGKDPDGRLELKESRPNQEVVFLLSMQGGKLKVNGRISLRPEGSGTRVVWKGSGAAPGRPYIKLMLLLFKPLIGKGYLKRLNNLKNIVEKA